MELEETQEIVSPNIYLENVKHEQIGELGIRGKFYPVHRGRNTIGRNKDICDIILDFPSISRVHATIYASGDELHLMDLKSRTMTKLGDTPLTPLLAYPITNGSLIVLGKEICFFKTLNCDDDDLPMTQCDDIKQEISIPETPVSVLKLQKSKVLVPESPEVETSPLKCIVGFNKTVGPDYDISIHEMETQNPFLFPQPSGARSPILSQKQHSSKPVEKDIPVIDKINSPIKSNIDNTSKATSDSDQEIFLDDLDDNEILNDSDIENSQILVPECVKNMRSDNSGDSDKSKEVSKNKSENDSDSTDCDDIFNMCTQKLPPVSNCNLKSTEIYINNSTKEDIQLVDTQINIGVPENNQEDIQLMATQIILPENSNSGKTTDNLATPNPSAYDNNQEDIQLRTTQIILPENSNSGKRTDNLATPNPSAYDNNQEDIQLVTTQIILPENSNSGKPTDNLATLNPSAYDNNQEDIQLVTTQIILPENSNSGKTTDNLATPNPSTYDNNQEDIQLMTTQTILPEKTNSGSTIDNLPTLNPSAYDNNQEDIQLMCTQIIIPEDSNAGKTTAHDQTPNTPIKLTAQNDNDIFQRPQVSVLKCTRSGQAIIQSAYTPEKTLSKDILELDLPNSQEIKNNICSKVHTFTDLTSESEAEEFSEELTPKYQRNKRLRASTNNTKINIEALPTILLTRTRKPSTKLLETDKKTRVKYENMLKSKILTEETDSITKGIVMNNISRLKEYKRVKDKSKLEKIEKDKDKAEVQKEKRTSKERTRSKIENVKGTKQIKLSSYYNKSTSNDENKSNNTTVDNKLKKKKAEDSTEIHDLKYGKDKLEVSKRNSERKLSNSSSLSKMDRSEPLKNRERKEKASKKEETEDAGRSGKRKFSNCDNKSDNLPAKRDSKGNKEKEAIKEKIGASGRSSRRKLDKDPKEREKATNNHESRNSKEKSEESGRLLKRKLSDKAQEVNEVNKSPELIRRSKRLRQREKDINYKEYSTQSTHKGNQHHDSTIYDTENFVPKTHRKSSNVIRPSSSSTVSSKTPTKMIKTPYVVFSTCHFQEKYKLEKLGAVFVNDVKHSCVLVTTLFKRTFKVLCAISLGIPIVGESWIKACLQFGFIVDPWQYLLNDEDAEKRYHFNLKHVLTGERNFLRGYNISCTPNVTPPPPELKVIVECAGGVWRDDGVSRDGGDRWLCITNVQDKHLWPRYKLRGATLVSTELVLTGVLRQPPQINNYKYDTIDIVDQKV